MDFLQEFKNKGYFFQCTNESVLDEKFNKEKVTAYIGFDATAESLHAGSLMQIMILRLLQKYGHKPIVLIGGATTKIGDPSFKSSMRKMLSPKQIEQNIAGIKKSLSKFIKFGDGPSDALLLNNDDWLSKLNYLEFLQEYGSLFSVNKMLTLESVKQRLGREQSLSFLEFNYMLLQAYDFYYLNKHHNCNLQLGGSDQWGNITMGTDLARRLNSNECFGLTTPLLVTSSGAKMGKSEQGAVWLNEDMLSPYEYFQYWRNVEDADVIRFAKLFCEYDQKGMDNFESLARADINEAKKQLAFELTLLCHGEDNAERAKQTAIEVFEKGGLDCNLPTIEIGSDSLQESSALLDLIVKADLAESKSAARRLIKGNAVRINDQLLQDEYYNFEDILNNKEFKLSAGKKRHILVKLI